MDYVVGMAGERGQMALPNVWRWASLEWMLNLQSAVYLE